MLTTRSRIEVLQSSAEGGPISDENLTDYGWMKTLMNMLRGMAIAEVYRNDNMFDENLMQTVQLSVKDVVQEDECWNLLSMPQIQVVNSQVNGLGYAGSVRQDKNWRLVRNLAHWSNINRKRIGGNKKTAVYYMVEPQESYLRVFDVSVKSAFVQAIFIDPFDERLNFNEEVDMYPVTDHIFGLMEKYARTGVLRDVIRNIPNTVSNSASDEPKTEVNQ